MKLVDTEETIVLVTGSDIRAEERDRPTAYRLKAEVDRRGDGQAFRRAVVCLLYTSPSPRDTERSRMPSSA